MHHRSLPIRPVVNPCSGAPKGSRAARVYPERPGKGEAETVGFRVGNYVSHPGRAAAIANVVRGNCFGLLLVLLGIAPNLEAAPGDYHWEGPFICDGVLCPDGYTAAGSAANAAGFNPHTSYCGPVDPTSNGFTNPPDTFTHQVGIRCQDIEANQPTCNYTNGEYCAFAGFLVTTASCPSGQTLVDAGGYYYCEDAPTNDQDPGDPAYCVNKGVGPDSFSQFCGYEQPCPTLTCSSGCQVSLSGTDLSSSQFAEFQYEYTGNQCPSNDSIATENPPPPGMDIETETTTTTSTTSPPVTNPDGSTTTTTTTTTNTTTQTTGSSSSGTGSGASAEEIGNELTEATPGSTDYTGEMDGFGEGINDGFDGAEDALSDPNDFAGSTNISLVTSLLPSSGCTGSINIPIFDSGESLSVDCNDTTQLRSVLSWLVGLFAAIYIFQLITTKPS